MAITQHPLPASMSYADDQHIPLGRERWRGGGGGILGVTRSRLAGARQGSRGRSTSPPPTRTGRRAPGRASSSCPTPSSCAGPCSRQAIARRRLWEILCYVMLCYVMLYYIISFLSCAGPCSRRAIARGADNGIYIILYYIILYYIILYYIIPIVCWTLLQSCDRARATQTARTPRACSHARATQILGGGERGSE